MTQKKETKKRTIDVIILKQDKEGKGAHYFIKKDGSIIEKLSIDRVGKICDDKDSGAIYIILEGKYNRPQEKALLNILYSCFKDVGEHVEVKPFHVFHPGKVNPDLNIRSLMTRYKQNYVKRPAPKKPALRVKRAPSQKKN